MRKELEKKVNLAADLYNYHVCGSSNKRMRSTFYEAIQSYKDSIWHDDTEEPIRGQRIVMVHYNTIGGGTYVGKWMVEECGERKPMYSGCKWCYLCDIYG